MPACAPSRDACVPGALELPDTLPPLERAAFQELVAFTLLERSVRECEPHETRLDDGCREPYPAPLARIAGRIAHLRVHRAGYSHGVDVESQNCRTGFVDHDGNGTLDDCARSAPHCQTAEPWLEAQRCCPAACFTAYEALRRTGVAPMLAFSKVYFEDASCLPGVRALLGKD